MAALFSRTTEEEGALQITAGVALIRASQLLSWDDKAHRFVYSGDDVFNYLWRLLDPAFGRVILWSTFSTGAEYLFKGFLMANGDDIRATELELKLSMPTGPLDQWIDDVYANSSTLQKAPMPSFGTLGNVTADRLINASNQRDMSRATSAELLTFEKDKKRLVVAKRLLANAIRNRDTHAYIPNARENNRPMVNQLFRPAFNSMIEWLPASISGAEITARLKDTASVVAGLPSV
ncbi:hypothetical protein R69658_06852 [Paraburkholderia aspalathi]|uniref:Uncharacterized protein n=1 Tax=Paraburkholderia aspalathi TaxID=1324617 RepID=A0ABN7N1C7_9BURK|nr:hypothetical protein [Paraburkholderia aspalathi]MBK3823209.1 hypothetical protein [Paraburkholderia aspalathi]MBK3835040.1 hypothetical protein [Paraburkholderia aspalathi]MBK3864788.1 hypothetical protein [Paraburkholderia aspalathi]CAE6843946.1 hypothetical protein R69658_06852 [Paraburkholderia aspalathi]